MAIERTGTERSRQTLAAQPRRWPGRRLDANRTSFAEQAGRETAGQRRWPHAQPKRLPGSVTTGASRTDSIQPATRLS
jgi:hypothetical protein